MRRHGHEQEEAGRRDEGAHRRRQRAQRPVAEALVEHRDPDGRRDHRVDHGHRRQRRRQSRPPVGGLRQQQTARRQRGDRRQIGPHRGRRVQGESLRHRLREHRGHAEGRTGRRGQQHTAPHRPMRALRRQEQHGHRRTRDHQQQGPTPVRQRLLRPALAAGQGQQPRQADRGRHRPAPGRGARPAMDEDGCHREREDDGQGAERLHQAERPVRQRHHVQQCAERVQPDREPPTGPAQGRVGPVRRARRHLLLDDGAARVRDGGHQAEQNGHREGTHEFHNARPRRPIPPPRGASTGLRVILSAYSGGTTERSDGRIPAAPSISAPSLPTVTGPSPSVRRPGTGLSPGASPPYSGPFGTSAAGGRGRVIKERQRP